MPALSRARNQAKSVLCQTNLHGWGLEFQLYAHDNEGSLPLTKSGNAEPDWADFMWAPSKKNKSYKGPDLLVCPMATKRRSPHVLGLKQSGTTFSPWSSVYGTIGSYGLNHWCTKPDPMLVEREGGYIWGFEAKYAWRIIHVKGASTIPTLADCMVGSCFPLSVDEPPEFPDYYTGPFSLRSGNAMQEFCIDRHRRGSNAVFMDGSVRKVGLKELWTLRWHRNYDACGAWTKCGGIRADDWPEWMRGYRDY